MDVHTQYASDYIVRCVGVLKSSGADNVGGPARTSADTFWGRAIAAAYHSNFACGGASFHDPEFEGYVDTVTYGCWWRTIFSRIGLFDETLVRNQDDEFNLRLVRGGGKIWQSPSIVSWYSPRSNLSALFRQYSQYGFWKVSVIRKHRLPASWRHLVPGAFVFYAVGGLLVAWVANCLGYPSVGQWSFAIWLTGVILYLLSCLGASARTAAAFGWDLFPALPAVFATYHISYGLGFLAGVTNMCRIGGVSKALERTLSQVKR
jgi:hypothetical protein